MPPKGKAGKAKAKKKKDPNAPKRSLSSYMLWLGANREKMKTANPEIKNTDLLKLAGVEWKKITESEKKKWEALALKKKEEYLKAKAAYAASGGAGDADDDE